MIGDRERCLQAGMDDHITSMSSVCVAGCGTMLTDLFVFFLEPLRRGDLLNAINKLAGERAASKYRRKLRPAGAIP